MKNHIVKILLIGILCFVGLAHSYAQKKTVEFYGNAGNLTGNVVGGVSMMLGTDSLGNYISAKGCYDNKKLFGCFDLGKPVSSTAFSGSESTVLKFEGFLTFGGTDGSGFPANSKSIYVMWLVLTPGGISGMYIINKIPGIIETEQTGIISLSYK
jgi:hypothetical protein